MLGHMAKRPKFNFKAEHKNPSGGLSEAGRRADNRATGANLKPPQPEGGSRRLLLCANAWNEKETNVCQNGQRSQQPYQQIIESLEVLTCP